MGDVNTSYVSDHTKWIDEQLKKHPEWVEDQKVGRALWWDKKQDLQTTERYAASKVPQNRTLTTSISTANRTFVRPRSAGQ